MTRKMLGGIFAAALTLPALAYAKPNATVPLQMQNAGAHSPQFLNTVNSPEIGNGNNSRSNGDVTGPGRNARVDTSTRGPLNDRQPGNTNSEDVPGSVHPKPAF